MINPAGGSPFSNLFNSGSSGGAGGAGGAGGDLGAEQIAKAQAVAKKSFDDTMKAREITNAYAAGKEVR